MEVDIVFVSDCYSDEKIGGVENSFEALVDTCPSRILKLKSDQVDIGTIQEYMNKIWIFGNYKNLAEKIAVYACHFLPNYYVVEFDYLFCEYRNVDYHYRQEGGACDCASTDLGAARGKFLFNASCVFYMSEEQRKIHAEHFPELAHGNSLILSSVFADSFFDKLGEIRGRGLEKNKSLWAICGSKNWDKGRKKAIDWCVQSNFEYVEIDDKDYDDTLEILARAQGLCFIPDDGETCSRLVIAAKLLGCELHINDKVQHKNEEWFATDDLQSIEHYLQSVPGRFWNEVLYDYMAAY